MATKTNKPTPLIPEEDMVRNSEELVSFKRSHYYSVLVLLAFAVGVLVGYVARDQGTTSAAVLAPEQSAGQINEAPVTPQPQYTRYNIPIDGFPSFGPEDAEIVIVEFGDFQCPLCRRFHEQTFQALLDAYPGQIRFVYRNFPIPSLHPDAMSAAVASLCANDQNAYWKYYESLFSSETFGEETYIRYATDLGLDMDAFKECLVSNKHNTFIQEDMDFSLNLGINGTPTFFINGLAIVGAQPLTTFKQVIDKELAGEIP